MDDLNVIDRFTRTFSDYIDRGFGFLGEDVAYDVDRTYTMERAGYRVRWREIPAEITPMNRRCLAIMHQSGRIRVVKVDLA